ncbi:MAG: hypothetical protein CL942_08370 [Desulfovibrio sp.]|nr:hypothetical protein [Desulfovibrio sp.]|tara:strand:- start:8873 stop:9064 length:192 start_codon:yes stop_codon:yes gene_type:complete
MSEEHRSQKQDNSMHDGAVATYARSRKQVLEDMERQANRFKELHKKVTHKLNQGVRRYNNDSV